MAKSYCPRCKENSVVRVIRFRKFDGAKTRFEYCANIGCTYKLNLSPEIPLVSTLKKRTNKGQFEFTF